MKTNRITALIALSSLLVLSAVAQIATPFPSGIDSFSAPSATNAALWNQPAAANGLNDLYFDSELTVPSALINSWATGPVDLNTVFGGTPFSAIGGSVHVIFLGETAGWSNDFGYVNSSAPGVYNPLITDLENSLVNNTSGANILSGDETYVNYSGGQTLDFFLNSGGDIGQGGMFFSFSGTNLFAGSDVSSHTRYSVRDVNTNYFDGTSYVTGLVKTVLVGFEDVRNNQGFYDNDANDLVMAFQFLPTQPPVPEPSTYGLIGAAALVGLVIRRRMVAKKA